MSEELSGAARAVEALLGTEQPETEEKICIVRDVETGELAWRFSTQSDPLGLMLRALFHSLMMDSGFRQRIETLEREVAKLGAGVLSKQ